MSERLERSGAKARRSRNGTRLLVDVVREGKLPGMPAWLESRAALWTRRKYEPNRDHALEVLADSWYHLLCDEA